MKDAYRNCRVLELERDKQKEFMKECDFSTTKTYENQNKTITYLLDFKPFKFYIFYIVVCF